MLEAGRYGMTTYDPIFFDYVNAGSVRSARHLLPVLPHLKIRSVLDVGCGQGAWLSVWRELGVETLTGIDGDYVGRLRFGLPTDSFKPHDLSIEFDLGRRFDLVQCLEVAEHLPATSAAGLIASLVRHGEMVLFSAAPKGQGGDNHVNEQEYDYWRIHFSHHDYVAIDYVRPLVIADDRIEPWYRYNTLLYCTRRVLAELPDSVMSCRVLDGEAIRDISPPLYKLRKLMLRWLPVAIVTKMSKLKQRQVVRRLKRASA